MTSATASSIQIHSQVESRSRRVAEPGPLLTIASSEDGGFWTLQSGVFPENEASIALHLALGFRVVGIRERIGRSHGVWRDVVLLERRSETNA